ncbi:ClpXP adapter SpxH family protein [Paracnuella aquatica]|uniref:ClpXP adapter SpxH family protein n=1 Tax=Paracnuella aquatica TaxID=2268757 RepID=UPI000DEFCA68|nr:ClpXP adapter SpxH family protein [Paracnuella aquatica]RPD44195.1 DsbA family protein [Paracnuella aquatica]
MEQKIVDTLLCDMETGICEVPQATKKEAAAIGAKPVKLLYFTDPICSSCWGIEPQLRKLKQEYGNYFNIEYRMGGLLKSWSEYGGRDVTGPQSVAPHWKEAAAFYEMPIDGDVWLEDPLHSSYPPSVAFKAAQLQGNEGANRFLRRIKEMVFLGNKNITKTEHLVQAATDAGLDAAQFEKDYEQKAKELFEDDLSMAGAWGVRGFPTIYFIDEEDNRFKVYGSKPYGVYEQALLKLVPGEPTKSKPASFETIFDVYETATLKEFAVFYDITSAAAESTLNSLVEAGKIIRLDFNAGPLWKRSNSQQ